MALSWKARRRWALFALVVALPLYIVVAVTVVTLFERPHFLLELLIYVVLGILWAFPLKKLFMGISQPDPDAPRQD
ncbi:DUF2842 domain-containing protein [Roseinatronobacter bogoriensis]|jgi:predicted MFS family arabinose efflux permease|uniref:DUF2842 domain-containing protein n=1 Tax=Roseinatronobacter bogoriensis subsp. barguzinensis TaxID=441209 RepID=A0A2K8K7Q0_9RHOB|nr:MULTISPECIES: DUF2842 domain-containing protein [Rhodobaca]ATX65469.1 DUF2842 domain-containing protein [Rhodobaca barguzinensis]MBB4209060.1 putative MFS family arabinose efflux permease [Rhodobaca bogoriensis DSM 18756]TDW37514.1 uncharacterized protein DUF2842 [Rhodobaca barguzinensis]TDY68125.1 uncharacterized protein DUF2842 [Rhodobaca bogoriensis DSM 18756]